MKSLTQLIGSICVFVACSSLVACTVYQTSDRHWFNENAKPIAASSTTPLSASELDTRCLSSVSSSGALQRVASEHGLDQSQFEVHFDPRSGLCVLFSPSPDPEKGPIEIQLPYLDE